jgi:methylated-DNA-[protein]-cysteine S-methyltransferase
VRTEVESPIGTLILSEANGAITAVDWPSLDASDAAAVFDQARAELAAYFAGDLTQFAVPLAPGGSAFQQEFYSALCAIPYGETRSYGDLAADLGVSAQAIGQACGANPIPIFIPCHRVLGAGGLGGYSGAGGVETKVALLKLEGAASLLI